MMSDCLNSAKDSSCLTKEEAIQQRSIGHTPDLSSKAKDSPGRSSVGRRKRPVKLRSVLILEEQGISRNLQQWQRGCERAMRTATGLTEKGVLMQDTH